MSLLGPHLGSRASALLDGQLPAEETERWWQHVADCTSCSHQIERETWLKRRLACLGTEAAAVPSVSDRLKADLMASPDAVTPTPWSSAGAMAAPRPRRAWGVAVMGSGAVGAACLGVLTLGAGPADAPAHQRNTPITAVNTTVSPATAVVNVRHSRR